MTQGIYQIKVRMPALTAPFIITTWLFIWAGPLVRLHPVTPAEATKAEGNLRAFRAKKKN